MKIGFYECDITPPLDSFMPGYYENRRGMTIYENLFAKAVSIQNGDNTAIMVCFDTCMFPDDAHDIITQRIERFTGVKSENISVSVNHAHTGGPVVDLPQANVRRDEAYVNVTFRRIADAAIMAYRNMTEGKLYFGKNAVEGLCFNRTHLLENGRYITHGCGRKDIVRDLNGVDPDLSFILAEVDGKKIGAIVNYALHPDNLGIVETRGFSGDYPSIISQKLKEAYGKDFVSFFVLGSCGDINDLDPSVDVDWNNYHLYHRVLGKTLADSILATPASALEEIDGEVQCIKESFTFNRRELDDETLKALLQNNCLRSGGAGNLLAYKMYRMPLSYEGYIQAMRIGDVCFGFVPGEIFVNYGLRFKAESPFKHNIFVELSNAPCGYVADENLYVPQSDLYETSLSPYTNTVPETGNQMLDKLLELSERLHGNH